MIEIEMYHDEKPEDADYITCLWSNTRCCYWGWIYKDNRIIGDYNATTLQAVEEAFSHLLEESA